MPPSDPRWQKIDQELPPDDHARIARRQLEQLDRNIVDQAYLGVGKVAFDPMPLLAMVLYQYLKGRRSPATWEEEARLNEAMQWLGYGYTPARRTWYEFRDRIGDIIELLHVNLVQQAIVQGHLAPSTDVQDGTSIAACASRHRMVNQQTLTKRQQLLSDVIEGVLPDSEEPPKWVPPMHTGQLDLALRMQTAAEVLTGRITENAGKPSGKRKDPDKGYIYIATKHSVQVVDTETGELVGDFGSYGNWDCKGKGSAYPHPELPFGSISGLAVWKDKLFVMDVLNRRLVKPDISYDPGLKAAK